MTLAKEVTLKEDGREGGREGGKEREVSKGGAMWRFVHLKENQESIQFLLATPSIKVLSTRIQESADQPHSEIVVVGIKWGRCSCGERERECKGHTTVFKLLCL